VGTTRTSKSSAASRETITFRAYYWEAYNEIVQPRAIGRYLIRRWLPDLGTNGFAIVQVLRDRAYFNAETGELRNDIFVESMDEFARMCSMSPSTLRRELKNNAALAEFVRKAPAYQPNRSASPFGRNVEKAGTVYWVAMDDPIHPCDEARYQELKQRKELEQGQRKTGASGIPTAVLLAMRDAPSPVKPEAEQGGGEGSANTGQNDRYWEPANTGQNDRYWGPNNGHFDRPQRQNDRLPRQNDGDPRQNDRLPRHFDRLYNKVDPSSSFPLYTSDTAALPFQPNGCHPEGQKPDTDPLIAVWDRALGLLAGRVNTPTLETHLRPLRIASVDEDGAALLLAPHESTRDWIEKRHLPAITEALGEALGRPVTVRLRLVKEFLAESGAAPPRPGRP